MLAERWGRRAQLPRRRGQLVRCSGYRERFHTRLAQLSKKTARLEMLRCEQIAHRGHRCEWDPALLRGVVDGVDALLLSPLLQKNLERVPVLRARQPIGKQFHFGPLGPTHELDE